MSVGFVIASGAHAPLAITYFAETDKIAPLNSTILAAVFALLAGIAWEQVILLVAWSRVGLAPFPQWLFPIWQP